MRPSAISSSPSVRTSSIARSTEANEAAGLAVEGFRARREAPRRHRRRAKRRSLHQRAASISSCRGGCATASCSRRIHDRDNSRARTTRASRNRPISAAKAWRISTRSRPASARRSARARPGGADATGALERASRLEAQASRSALRHAITRIGARNGERVLAIEGGAGRDGRRASVAVAAGDNCWS